MANTVSRAVDRSLAFGFSCLISFTIVTHASLLSDIVDLTHGFGNTTFYWPAFRPYRFQFTERFKSIGPNDSYVYEANVFCAAEHGGTHLDAPRHLEVGKQGVAEIPLTNLIGSAVVIDVSTAAARDRDYLIGQTDFEDWESRNGRIPDASIVMLYTGFSRFYPNATLYLGTAGTNLDLVNFPGLHPDGAKWLIQKRMVKAVGIDTASIDYGQSTTIPSHVALMAENIPVFENVANLDQLSPTGYTVIALPMKIEGGSGAPLRVIAVKESTTRSSGSTLDVPRIILIAVSFACVVLIHQAML